MTKYFLVIRNGKVAAQSLYKTTPIKFSDGSPTLNINRWNWDFENWNGWLHNYDEIKEALTQPLVFFKDFEIREITDSQMKECTLQS